MPASGALPLERASELMKAGYLELENGYTRMDNGIVYVAALTRMETPEPSSDILPGT
ncbi:MAG: hypothetical protein IT364_04350 [Candidatus Hydrogenedentes bacterium]|nr:hypothetical protein [Candidatus Hydrogenedentota bacterium]